MSRLTTPNAWLILRSVRDLELLAAGDPTLDHLGLERIARDRQVSQDAAEQSARAFGGTHVALSLHDALDRIKTLRADRLAKRRTFTPLARRRA